MSSKSEAETVSGLRAMVPVANPMRFLVLLLLHDMTSHHDTIPAIPESITTNLAADTLGIAESMPTHT
jgi:hypothetical protein